MKNILRLKTSQNEEFLYWSNEDGWVDRESANVFDSTEGPFTLIDSFIVEIVED